MDLADLVSTLQASVTPAVWTAAVTLARQGAVEGLAAENGEVELRVKARGRALPHEVFLYADDPDGSCDCGAPLPCVHVCAAAIAARQGLAKRGTPLPEPAPSYRVQLRYDFVRDGVRLRVSRRVLFPDGRDAPLTTTLAESNFIAHRGDVAAEALLATYTGGALEEDRAGKLLIFLEGDALATLDGEPVEISDRPVPFVIRVSDEGDDFRVGIYRPDHLDDLFVGAALRDGVLYPTSYGTLPPEERRALSPRRGDRVFGKDRVSWLVSDYLPRLRGFGLPVEIATQRLPTAESLVPRVVVDLRSSPEGLRVRPELVYGDPPVARIRDGAMIKLGAVVPARDHAAERRVTAQFQERVKLVVGHERLLPPSEAASLLNVTLPRLDVEVTGHVEAERYEIRAEPVTPHLDVQQDGDGAFKLDVQFHGPSGGADPAAVLRAWRAGRSLVPLLDGGYAPLPADWLKVHGGVLQELLEARDAAGRVERNATAALAELLEGTEGSAPPDLTRLQHYLERGEGLPEVPPPAALDADLRPYQLAGFRWLRFLRDMDLHGVLADDMGLGKTVQALAVLADTPGPHLVVGPTSVLSNWAREAARFTPGLRVCLYHGPNRQLDPDADIVLTSYTLLRLDKARLLDRDWSYGVLDEAQAIKNPDSQTSRTAFRLRARHRLCLSGTPVENRLEELWSLFRFLMPGLLGSRETFKERFVRPVEVGDMGAAATLRKRVRPYVLRRMKKQVATDLPPLTDVVITCEMSPAQRAVYDAARATARADVMAALARGERTTMAVLEALLRMRQAACDPTLLPGGGQGAPSAKLDKLEELLVELVTSGSRALVFSQFTGFLDRVQPRLAALGIPWVRLDGSTRDRQAVIDRFQADDGPPVFLLSLKAGGTGLNLTAADYVIHLDPWWNPAVQQQATDRAHRIGQDKPVISMRLVAEHTVEERILALQDAKRELAEAALGGDGGFLRALSGDELRALFNDE